VLKCEKKGTTSQLECNPTDPNNVPTSVDQKAADKFPLDLAKCDDKKFNPTKKGSDYDAIGCPGDCDPNTDGLQRCANFAAYEATVEGNGGIAIKAQVPLLSVFIELSCVTDSGQPINSEAVIDCATNDSKRLAAYAKGVFNCNAACENDYKNKKGNGGPGDTGVCLITGTPSSAFTTCLGKKADKHLQKLTYGAGGGNGTTTKALIDAALDQANDDLFNRDNPTENPDTDVCGTCGNGTREGAEECDGGDDSLCGTTCDTDCTCL
jgi:hypothetical protein